MQKYTENKKTNTSNNRIKLREMSDVQIKKDTSLNHSKTMDRLLLDREFLFDKNSNTLEAPENTGRFGEIIGDQAEMQKIHQLERGQPMRSQYQNKKQIYDQNTHLDFDLYDDKPSTLNVNYYDPSATQNSGYAEVTTSMTQMSTQLNPPSVCSSIIEKTNNNIFYYLSKFYENTYGINGYGLVNLFASLYFSSSGITEMELKKFFDFPKKDMLYTGLQKISSHLAQVEKMINFKNFIIIGNDTPYDMHYHDKIRDFCILIRVDITKPVSEATKMNSVIKKIMGSEMRSVITPDNLKSLQMMLLTTAVVQPVWASPFDRITKSVFHYYDRDDNVNYLHSIGKSYGYFEDSSHQLLEIKCAGGSLIAGFLLNKENIFETVDNVKLHFYISKLKESILDEVKIPIFQKDVKIRFNNTLQNMGLGSVFIKVICPEFFPESVVLQDIVQNIKIIIDDYSVKDTKVENVRGYRTNRKFICNQPFVFYFRLAKTDTILLLGMYQ